MPDRILGNALDGHTFTGIGGFLASIVLSDVSTIASIAVGAATAAYMAMRAYREWMKIRAENHKPKLPPDFKKK